MLHNLLTIVIDSHFPEVFLYILFNLILNPLVFILVSTYFFNKGGISLMKSIFISLTIALIVIVGSRIIHAILALNYYQEFSVNPWELAPRNFTMYGGFVLAFPSVFIICKIIKFDFWKMLDLLIPGWSLGIVFNKTGCLFNGCCFGVPTTLPFGISYPEGTQPYSYFYDDLINLVGENGNLANSIPIHAVQSYEALVGLVGFIFSVYLLKRNPKRGVIFGCFAMYYSFARLVLNNFRATPYNMMEIKDLLPFLYLGIFIITVFIFIFRIKKIEIRATKPVT